MGWAFERDWGFEQSARLKARLIDKD